jgi:hypothetical protein
MIERQHLLVPDPAELVAEDAQRCVVGGAGRRVDDDADRLVGIIGLGAGGVRRGYRQNA